MSQDLPTPPLRAVQPSRWGNRILVVLFAAVFMPVIVTILYHYAPTDPANSYYPGCLMNKLTGTHCPGCGATRCSHALLHGDIEQALAWNPLFVVLLPYLLYGVACICYSLWTGKRARGGRLPGWAGTTLLVVIVAYWILRNIPFEPFIWLAPHELDERLFP